MGSQKIFIAKLIQKEGLMDLEILKITDYELECYVVSEVPPKVGKTPHIRHVDSEFWRDTV